MCPHDFFVKIMLFIALINQRFSIKNIPNLAVEESF